MKNKPAQPESSLKENLEVAGFETCPNEKAFTSAPLCDVRSGEGWQRRGEVKAAFRRGVSFALGFLFTLGASAILAVAVTGTVNTFVNGSVMEASQLNTNFSSLKTAIEGITSSQWTSNGTTIYYNAGDIGIGTSSPQSTLGINVALADTKGVVLQYNGETKAGILVSPTTGEVRIGALNPTGTYFPTIYSNNTERMRIDLSGNVGIGTTSPGAKLDINKTSAADNEGLFTIGFQSGGIGSAGFTRWNMGAAADRMGLEMHNTDTGSSKIWIDNAGRMRIAGSTPSAQTDGTAVGDQTSTRDSKQDIHHFNSNHILLEKIAKVPLCTFIYKNEAKGYGEKAKRKLGFIADEVDPLFMDEQGRAIDQVSVNGILIGALQELKSLYDNESLKSKSQEKSISDLLLQLKQATERLDTEKKKNDKLAEELAAVKTHDRVSQQNLQRIIEKQEKLLAETDRRLRALETFQTAAANANAGKERKQ